MSTVVITREVAAKVLSIVDAGLSNGLGEQEPGKMCVEAAVCYALGLPHGDDPGCVSNVLRSLKISLNDKAWSSPQARAKGLRRLAIAQLGSKGAINDVEFVKRVAEMTIRTVVPRALRAAAPMHPDKDRQSAMLAAAERCEKEGSQAAAKAAANAAAANAAAAAVNARDTELSIFAEGVVQVLIEMEAPGCEWLDLADAA